MQTLQLINWFWDDLIVASAELVDSTFLGAGAGTDVIPAGILNGVTAVPSSGITAADYEKDLMPLITTFVEANVSTDNAYFLMSETRAIHDQGNVFYQLSNDRLCASTDCTV